MICSLVVLNGANPGAKLRLGPDVSVATIGRHLSNDLPLDDDRASRLHARVVFRGERWHIEDCGSLNGTYVNSQPVQQSVLEPGDLIRIGERLMLFVEESSASEAGEVQTSVFRGTTTLARAGGETRRGSLLERSVSESMARAVRDSAVLCRLANLLQQHSDVDVLIRSAIDALVEGIGAEAVCVWLVGADGRLRCAGRCGEPHDQHLLASLAVEKKKAIVLEHADGMPQEQTGRADRSAGSALGVPIPGPNSCRGAIECHRRESRGPFSQSDLDLAVVIAHQAGLALENLEHRERLEQANAELRRRLSTPPRLIGSSPAMQRVREQIARVAPTNSTVLILGESGTGKELVARSIHELSRKSAGPYVTVNCAAFSESLLESELFGHEAGAFTGAERRHIGQFERAHRGTLFLDEVGEMSLACQAKLLRVLEGHPFQRLGGHEMIDVDVRVISATHSDLPALIAQKRFREDLFYRLRVIDMRVPPLRERGDDVITLAAVLLETVRSQVGRGPRVLSQDAMAAIRAYAWPGNVRELKNAIERAVVLGQGEEVQVADLGLPLSHDLDPPQPALMSLKEAERRHIEWVLQRCGGNKTQACRILGIGRATLYSKLQQGSGEEAQR